MARVPVAKIELDDSDLKRLRRILPKKVERGVRKTAQLIEAKATKGAPVDTGNLASSGTTVFRGSGYGSEAEVKFTSKYAEFVHEGTGIFGPKGKPFSIRPVRKRALFWPGADHPVRKVKVKGMRPTPFLKDAFDVEGPKLEERIFA